MKNSLSPPALPIIGHIIPYAKDPVQFQLSLQREFGKRAIISVFGRPVHFFFDPEYVKQILVTDGGKVRKGNTLQTAKFVIGNNIITAEGEEHLKRRKVLSKAFSNPAVLEYEGFIQEYLNDKMESIKPEKNYSLVDLLDGMASDIISTILFGKSLEDVNKLVIEHLKIGIKLVTRCNIPFYHYLLALPLPLHLEFRKTQKVLQEKVKKLMEERKSLFTKDIVSILTKEGLSEKELYEQVLVFYMAGHETTATTLIWIFFALATQEYDEEKLVSELKNAKAQNATFKDLDNYIYTKAVINETLRLYPAVWTISRQLTEDIDFKDFKLKKGAYVSLSPLVSARNSDYFENPETFNPMRWIDSNGDFKEADKFVFFPFSQGNRNCIGKYLSLSEIFRVLMTMIPNYKVELVSEKNIDFMARITLRPKQDLKVKFIKRM